MCMKILRLIVGRPRQTTGFVLLSGLSTSPSKDVSAVSKCMVSHSHFKKSFIVIDVTWNEMDLESTDSADQIL
ncbi:hypothetical protein IWZ03DRAFT_374621 [Phyllosticta citriasiana]|uniref:Uncharacterized protein n=1 Tax=Phyllosticta citriasiana TaxID=595635 RepID=A0ABR1KQX8_9PEZI